MSTWKNVERPRPGDWATHVDGGPWRRVHAVGVSHPIVTLMIDGIETEDLPVTDFTYRREVFTAKEKRERNEGKKRMLARLPWVRRLAKTERCDRPRWSSMSLKDAAEWHRYGTVPDHARCKRMAEFRLISTVKGRRGDMPATPGNYCWGHLADEIYDHRAETRRMTKWFENHPEKEEQA